MQKIINQNFHIKYEYNIYFTRNIFNLNNKILINELNKQKTKKNMLILIDKNLIKFHVNLVKNIHAYIRKYKNNINLVCDPIILTGGERIKNHQIITNYLYKLIDKFKICRQSYIMVIGGGTLQDLIGYIASTAHRGIKLIRMPTTVLSQDDSGIGVKNGINFSNKKNFIGCFTPPNLVINDYNFLLSLTDNQKMDGISEALKVALIKNKKFFEYIEKQSKKNILQTDVLEKIIYECAKLHAEHISKCGDPFEKTSSRPLDFGHWIAHKLETLSRYKIPHGKSVAIGIAIDSTYSYLLKLITKKEWKRIITVFINLKLNIFSDNLFKINKNKYEIFNGLEEFREHLGGKLTITLLKNIGNKIDVHHISKKIYIKTLKLIRKINNKVQQNDKII